MADRILIWHIAEFTGERHGPTYYADADYKPTAVRVHAEVPPSSQDMQFAIYDDGESIFRDWAAQAASTLGGRRYTGENKYGRLPKNQTTEENAENFDPMAIEKGSWIHCQVTQSGGSKNITISLEMDKL